MKSQGKLTYYCISPDCQSKIKIITTFKEILTDHGHHLPNFKTFEELQEELLADNHPLKDAQINFKDDLYTLIENEITSLVQIFTALVNELQSMLKDHVSKNTVSLSELFKLYNAVIEKNHVKIEEYQPFIPRLSISLQEMVDQEGKSKGVKEKIEEVFSELKQQIQALKTFTIRSLVEQKWSTTFKHDETQINGATVSIENKEWRMILLEPSFTMTDVFKVKLKVLKLYSLLISLSDINVAKDRQPTWDHRLDVGDGTYSHNHRGCTTNDELNLDIYPHHLASKQQSGEKLAFAFKEGDILQLEWNGPLKLFITSKLSTKESYTQSVQFKKNAQLYFGVQMFGPTQVEIQ